MFKNYYDYTIEEDKTFYIIRTKYRDNKKEPSVSFTLRLRKTNVKYFENKISFNEKGYDDIQTFMFNL